MKKIFLCLFLFYYSPVMAQTQTLKELIQHSPYIVIAEKHNPAITLIHIPIHANSKKYPPFESSLYHYRLLETLKSSSKKLPQNLEILEADFELNLMLYKKMVFENTSKSPIYEHYPTSADLEKSSKIILFLRPAGGEEGKPYLTFTMSHSYEGLDKLEEVKKGIKDKPEYGSSRI